MKNKKRMMVILGCLVLNLAIMACHIPLVSQSVGTPESEMESPKVTQIEVTEDVSPTATKTLSSDSITMQVYSGEGVEITLPDTFIIGDSEDIEALLEDQALLDGEQAQSFDSMFESFKDDIILWGYDTNTTNQGETGLFVMKNEQFGGISLMMISAFIRPMLGSQVEILDQEMMAIGDRNVLRFLTSPNNMDFDGTQVFYMFNEDGKLWIIGFLTNTDLAQDRLSGFDDAVASFRIIEGE